MFQAKTSNMKVNEEKPLLCDLCCKSFMTLDEFSAHGKIKHQENIASICSGETTPSETCQGNDMLMKIIEQDNKPQLCDEWDEVFTDSDSFIAHKEVRKKEQFFVCAECKRIFTVEENLDRHLEEHSLTATALMNNKKSDYPDPNLLQSFKIFHRNANEPNAIPFKLQFAACTSMTKDTEPNPDNGIARKMYQCNKYGESFLRRL